MEAVERAMGTSAATRSFGARAILGQALYYIATGLWPLLSIRTFEAVLGPKTDDWLVYMVGLLAIAIGVALLSGTRRSMARPETRVLAIAAALAFISIDVIYALDGRISRLYLVDALIQLLFMACAVWSGSSGHKRSAARRDRRLWRDETTYRRFGLVRSSSGATHQRVGARIVAHEETQWR
jgi:hypothetical protein